MIHTGTLFRMEIDVQITLLCEEKLFSNNDKFLQQLT